MSYTIEPKDPPGMKFVGEIVASVGERKSIEQYGPMTRAFTPVLGGRFTGPDLHANILSGGGDFSVDINGVFRLEARYLMEAENGDVIEIQNRGVGHSTPEIFETMIEHGKASLDSVYFRTTALFFTDSQPHGWLGEKVFVGVGREFGTEIVIHIYEVH